MVALIIPVIAALVIPASYAFSPIVTFDLASKPIHKEHVRIPAYNSSSNKQLKHVSERAVEQSPVLFPENPQIVPTAVPTLFVTVMPTEQPVPTAYPTLIIEPTGLIPIDPPPCSRKNFELDIKERPVISEEANLMMPCTYLDQQ